MRKKVRQAAAQAVAENDRLRQEFQWREKLPFIVACAFRKLETKRRKMRGVDRKLGEGGSARLLRGIYVRMATWLSPSTQYGLEVISDDKSLSENSMFLTGLIPIDEQLIRSYASDWSIFFGDSGEIEEQGVAVGVDGIFTVTFGFALGVDSDKRAVRFFWLRLSRKVGVYRPEVLLDTLRNVHTRSLESLCRALDKPAGDEIHLLFVKRWMANAPSDQVIDAMKIGRERFRYGTTGVATALLFLFPWLKQPKFWKRLPTFSKISLTTGVLLIGTCAVLFFTKGNDKPQTPPPLSPPPPTASSSSDSAPTNPFDFSFVRLVYPPPLGAGRKPSAEVPATPPTMEVYNQPPGWSRMANVKALYVRPEDPAQLRIDYDPLKRPPFPTVMQSIFLVAPAVRGDSTLVLAYVQAANRRAAQIRYEISIDQIDRFDVTGECPDLC
ncbi:MAG: hypothetical protein ABIQ65_06420 [Thermoanaerobaculia bacterium]